MSVILLAAEFGFGAPSPCAFAWKALRRRQANSQSGVMGSVVPSATARIADLDQPRTPISGSATGRLKRARRVAKQIRWGNVPTNGALPTLAVVSEATNSQQQSGMDETGLEGFLELKGVFGLTSSGT
jgi:hypothetical protein